MGLQKHFTEEERRAAKKESRRKWYLKNIERERERCKKWHEENRERHAIVQKKNQDRRRNDPNLFIPQLMTSINSRKRDGKVVDITIQDLEKLFVESKGVCAISGLPLTIERKNPLIASVDRIDSSKGYIKGNIQFVASCVNKAKSNMSQDEFITMCKAVVDNNS